MHTHISTQQCRYAHTYIDTHDLQCRRIICMVKARIYTQTLANEHVRK